MKQTRYSESYLANPREVEGDSVASAPFGYLYSFSYLQLDVSSKIKLWLSTEALKQNPKIDARESGHETPDYGPEYTYLFKPPYNIKNKKMLLRLLQVGFY